MTTATAAVATATRTQRCVARRRATSATAPTEPAPTAATAAHARHDDAAIAAGTPVPIVATADLWPSLASTRRTRRAISKSRADTPDKADTGNQGSADTTGFRPNRFTSLVPPSAAAPNSSAQGHGSTPSRQSIAANLKGSETPITFAQQVDRRSRHQKTPLRGTDRSIPQRTSSSLRRQPGSRGSAPVGEQAHRR